MSLHIKDGSRASFGVRSLLEFVKRTMPMGNSLTSCFTERMKPSKQAANQRRLTAVLATLLLVQMMLPVKVMAQAAPQGNMDLGSRNRTVTVDHHPDFQPTDIKVGRQTRTVNAGDVLTPAEYAALQQVMTTGEQTLRVGRYGNAVRGSLNLTPELTNVLHELVIPNRVTVVNDFGVNSVLDITGNLTNSGKFFAVSSNLSVTDAIINADNIFNNSGALLTSVLPTGGLAGFTNLASSLSLTLNAVHDIVNAGVISSSANLNLNAGGSIVNQATLQAAQNVNLSSAIGNIVNAGLVSSLAGNINIASQTVQNILINNVGGQMEALTGQINVRDLLFGEKADLDLKGGDWLSQELNLYSGTGHINVNVGGLTGVLNSSSHSIHVLASTDSLRFGSVDVTGDPVFANAAGDITLGTTVGVPNTGFPVAVLASGSIFSNLAGTAINTSNNAGAGGAVTMIAGANIVDPGDGTLQVTGPSCDGGDIILTNGVGVTQFDTRGTGASGGRVNIVAFPGGQAAGLIRLPTSLTIFSGRVSGGGSNGNVTILSGTPAGLVPETTSIVVGNINTTGVVDGTGNITVATATPVLQSTAACNPCVVIDNTNPGTTGGALINSSTITAGAIQQMSLETGSLQSVGATITVTAGSNARLNGVVQSIGSFGNRGTVAITTNSATPFVIGAGAGDNGINSSINVRTAQGRNGTINITSNGSGGIQINNTGLLVATGQSLGGSGGDINLTANDSGSLVIDTTANSTLSVNATTTGAVGNPINGGSISLSGRTVRVTGTPALLLTANGANLGVVNAAGNGGTISVTSTSPNADLEVGNGTGQFRVSAISGTAGTNLVNGGSVTFTSGRKLTVDPSLANLNVNPQRADGDGGSLTFVSTNPNNLGKVYVSGSVTLNGLGNGQGGSLSITSASPETFIVGTAATDHGVDGTITVNGSGDQTGGSVTISSAGTVLISDGISADGGATGGGGQVSVSSTNGGVVTDATISAEGGSTSGNGGTISLSAGGPNGIFIDSLSNLDVSVTEGSGGTINLTTTGGPLTIPSGTLAANGVDNGTGGAFTGGTINITALALNVTGGSSLDLQANGDDTGDGGNVTVNITGAIPNLAGGTPAARDTLFVNNVSGGVTISATSGPNGGNGGTVSVSSGRNLVVDPADVVAGPQFLDGTGAILTFANGTALTGTMLITDDLSANAGAVGGNGGTITLNVNSHVQFEINDSNAVTNGVDGSLFANAGGFAGNGGTVSVTNTGFGGIFVDDTSLISVTAGGLAGQGGNITLNAGNGQLTIDATSGGFNVDAVGIVDNQGGTITLAGFGIEIQNTFLALSANGVNAGAGGIITITNNGPVTGALADLVINNVAGGFTISATEGTSGNRGQITLSTGRDLFIDVTELVVDSGNLGAGNGAIYNLTAGTALPGNVQIVGGDLDTGTITNGIGGTVVIASNSTDPFDFAGAGPNGINGNILVEASGQGGSVTITNTGSGGITVNSPTLNFQGGTAGIGPGGSITLNAPNGTVSIDTTSTFILRASAAGGGDSQGGTISIAARALSINGPNNLFIQARGVQGGNGGTVSMTVTDPFSDLLTGVTPGRFLIDARSGSGGGNAGAGGNVTLSAGRDILINNFGLDIQAKPRGANGAGANFTLTAGTANPGGNLIITNSGISATGGGLTGAGTGNGGIVQLAGANVFVQGSIDAAAGTGGTGQGGSITIVSNSSNAFMIAPGAATNGVQGFLNVSAGTAGGAGSISVASNGPGGVEIQSLNDLILNVTSGAGGDVTIDAPNGPIFLGGGTLNVDAAGGANPGEFAGGTIAIGSATTTSIDIDTTAGDVVLSANGSAGGDGAGGTVSLVAGEVNVTGGNNVELRANATGNQNGGTITLSATQSDLSVDANLLNGFVLSATGGSPGSQAGNGGTVNLTAGTFMFVQTNPASFNANPLGNNGTGAQLSFTVLNGPLGVLTDLTANGVGTGNGGRITINVRSSTPFAINGSSISGVFGNIHANAGSGFGADGGTVIITQNGSGGISFGTISNALISVRALNDGGNGGTITVNTGTGGLFNEGAELFADATCGNGGQVTLNMASITNLDEIFISANGGGGGAGGQVNLSLTSVCQDLIIDDGNFVISATGGESGSIAGDGGTVTLQSARDLIVDLDNLNVGPQGDSGGGETLSFTAARNLSVLGNLDVSGGGVTGNGFGNGGSVTLASPNTRTFTIDLGNTGHGVDGLPVANAGDAGGNGGTISLQFPNATVRFPGGLVLEAQALAIPALSVNGGTITLNAGRIETVGFGPLRLDVFSAGLLGIGNGGTVNVTLTRPGESIRVGNGSGELIIFAHGADSGGDGGTVNLTAPRNVIVNPTFLVVGPQGGDGNGETLNFTATNGFVFFDGLLNVSGVGFGNGGNVNITSGATGNFDVGLSSGAGVAGNIRADAGGDGGRGGTVTITTSGALRFRDGAEISADAVTNGDTSGGFNGGTILITAPRMRVLDEGNFSLSADGAELGNGGSITLNATDRGTSLEVGSGSGQVSLSATGGFVGSLGGNGGSVAIVATNLNVSANALTVGPLGLVGNGATISLTAGANGAAGRLFFDGALRADAGDDFGNGGRVTLVSSSAQSFNVGTGTVNGVDGFVSANAGGILGNGGTIDIQNNNGGGVFVFSGSSIQVAASGSLGGDGGSISITANNGAVEFNTGAGLSANASVQGVGGQITISAGRLSLPGIGSVQLRANGAGTGNGGQVSVTTLGGSSASSLVVGTGNGQLDVRATGGSVGSLAGNGGTVIISSSRDLTVIPNGLNVDPQGLTGNGGTINLTAGTASASTMRITSDLFANGVGNGNGGSIILNVNSNQEFVIGAFVVPNGAVFLSANAGGGSAVGAGHGDGNGGTVRVTNTGLGGIFVDPASITVAADGDGGNGAGGNITLDARGGRLFIDADGGSFNVNALGAGSNRGGTITLIGSPIEITDGALVLTANGVNAGAGGTITVTNQGAVGGLSDLIVDDDPNAINVSATSGSRGGNGGTVNLSTGRNLVIDENDLQAGVQSPLLNSGNGATFNLTAGTAMPGNVEIFGGDLDASAGLNGNGGTINITMNSSDPFQIDPGFVPDNGIDGSLIARGGTFSPTGGPTGNGGTIRVTNNGLGGIFLDKPSFINVGATEGNGGSISLLATAGALVIGTDNPDIELNAAGQGGGNFNGGTITLTGRDLSVGGDRLVVDVSGVNGGNGGTVSVSALMPGANLNLGSDFGLNEIQIFATGGAMGSATGNGGTVNLSAGGSIQVGTNDVNGPGIVAAPLGLNGNGANYNWTGGVTVDMEIGDLDARAVGNGNGGTVNLQAGGNLFIEGNILAQGSGTGNGGNVTLVSGGLSTFVVGAGAGPSGVQGVIDASAGDAGNAGSIRITNNGIGGVRIDNLGDIELDVTRGSGGTVSINAPNGILSIGGGNLFASGFGGEMGDTFNAGTISLAAGVILFDNSVSDVDLLALGSGDGNGGTISVVAQSIDITGGDRVILHASGSGEGNGGTVTLSALGSNSELEVGFGDNMFSINAHGGSFGSQQGDGGTVTLTAGRSMLVNPFAIDAGPQGDNGNGANLSFTVTNGSPCCGNLVVFGDLNANGVGQGAGGSINISVNSQSPFDIGGPGALVNGVTDGFISASGGFSSGPANNGGTITIVNNGSGGIRFDEFTEINASAGFDDGSGGTISITTGSGGLITEGGLLIAEASCGTGGSVTLNMASLTVEPGANFMIIDVDAGGDFAGGTVSLSLASATQDLVVGGGGGQFIISAQGGQFGGLGGDGGTVTLSSGRDLIVDTNTLEVGPRGDNGGGAKLSFTAVRNLFVNNALNVDGVGFGNGGSVALSSSNTATFRILPGATVHGVNGFISANAGVDGGNGGSISLNFAAATLQLPGAIDLNANASGQDSAFNGGSITLNVGRVDTVGAGQISLNADGSGLGAGGTVTVTFTRPNENLTVGSGNGQLDISAEGAGDGGDGGSVSLTTPGNLTIDPDFLEAGPQGANGNGATLNFVTTTGVVFFDGNLNVSGVGAGDGGSVTILSGGAGTFDIGPGATGQGINGFVDASAGGDGGNGGTVSITAGGLTGTIRFFNTGGDIFADAVAADGDAQAFNGGSITLTASKFDVSNDAHWSSSADGASLGNGGSILVTTTGAGGSDIEIGLGLGQIDISATGGSAESLGGNGGTVSISATNLDVDPAALVVGPQGDVGNGATIILLAGAAGASGRLFVSNNLSADAGVEFGNGGAITLTSRNGQTFDVGADAGATVNGVDGLVSASAGNQSGNGGSVTITNDDGGGVRFGVLPSVFVDAGSVLGGDGGSITVVASNGAVEFEGAGLTADAFEQGAGGQISVTGERLVLPALGALVLSANGAGNGNGGSVSVFTLGSGGNASLVVGDDTGEIDLSATGGSVDSLTGDGGTIIVSSGRDLTVDDTDGLQTDPQGLSGAGATINLTAGTAGSGDLFVDGDLIVNGVGAGNGGSVSLTSNSSREFFVAGPGGGATINGVDGFISAVADGSAGNGGSVTITANGSGGVEFDVDPLFVDPSSSGGNGGTITVTASHASGDIVFDADGVILNASALKGINDVNGVFAGGQINLTAGRALVGADSGAVILAAASFAGAPGSITLTTDGASGASDIRIGLGAGEFNLIALSDTNGVSAVGTGGTVTVNAGARLNVEPAGISVGGVGANTNGGTMNLTAGGFGTQNVGRLFVDGNLQVDGVGVGNGGTINITSSGILRFKVFPGAGDHGVNGTLSANGGNSFGNGGSISITEVESGGIEFDATPDISVDPSANGGNGGTINLTATKGPIRFPGAGLTANALGGDSNGGTITISAQDLVLSPKLVVVEFDAIGFGGGSGGNVSISTTTKGSNLVVGPGAGQIVVDARGGDQFLGDGGTITISAGGNLTVDGAGLDVSSDGNVQGGQINLTAGAVKSGNFILRNNSLFAGFGGDDAIVVNVATKGKITTQGVGVAHEATTVGLTNAGGDIGTKKVPILTNAQNLSAVGSKNVFLRELSEVNLGASSAAKTFQLVSDGITAVSGNVSASKLLLTTLNDSSIAIGANLNGTKDGIKFTGTITLDADGAGNIFQLTGQMTAKTVTLSSDTGSIGVEHSKVIVSSGLINKAVTLNANAGGNVFVASTSPVKVKSASAGGTLVIESCGNLTATAGVTGDDVILAVSPGSDGDIKAKVNANSVSVFAPNPGSNAFLTSVGSIDLEDSNVGGILQLKVPGNIDVEGDVEAGSFRLFTTGDNGFIDIDNDVDAEQQVILSTKGPNSEIVIDDDLDMFADNGVMTLQTKGANSRIHLDDDDIDVFGDNSRVTLTTSGANSPIQLDNDIETDGDNDVVTLLTKNATSPININDDVRAEGANTVINMTAKSNIVEGGGEIEATTAKLTSSGGFIDVDTDVDFITAKAKGLVTIDEGFGVTLNSISTKNGDITVTTDGGVLSVPAKGKVNAKGSGPGAGDISLRNNDTVDGTIVFGVGAQVVAKAKAAGAGNVSISIGAPGVGAGAPPPNVTITEKNGGDVRFGTSSITALAPVNKLTAKGAILQFDVGASALGAAAITLEGKTKITADPPGLLPGSAGFQPASDAIGGGMIQSPDGGRGALHAPAGGLPTAPTGSVGKNELRLDQPIGAALQESMLSIPSPGITRGIDTIPLVMPPATFGTPDSSVAMPDGSVVTPNGGRGASHAPAGGLPTAPTDSAGKSELRLGADSDLQAVAYAPPAVRPGSAGVSARCSVATTRSGGTTVKHAGAAVAFDGADVVSLTDGEALISSSHNSVVRAGRHYVVTVASGAMALVSIQNGVLKVRSVYEGLHSPVRVVLDGRSVSLSAGQELIVSRDETSLKQAMRDDNVGRRKVKSFVVDGDFKVMRADVSLVSLLQHSDLLARLTTSQDAGDKSVAAKLMKMAACVMQVTSGRGAYSVADPAKLTSQEIKTPRRFNTVADARL